MNLSKEVQKMVISDCMEKLSKALDDRSIKIGDRIPFMYTNGNEVNFKEIKITKTILNDLPNILFPKGDAL